MYSLLGERAAIRIVEDADEQSWNDLRRGEIVEIEAIVEETGLQKVAEAFSLFEQILPMAQAAGVEGGLDPEGERILQFVRQLAGANPRDRIPVVASVTASPEFKFVADLTTDHVLNRGLIDGEVTLFGKIRRRLRPGETHMVGAVFGGLERLLDDANQKEIAQVFEKPEVRQFGLTSPLVAYPAAILTPLAIYR